MKDKYPASDFFRNATSIEPLEKEESLNYFQLIYLEQQETNKLLKKFMFRMACGLVAIWMVLSGLVKIS